jgi:hypothetical protein
MEVGLLAADVGAQISGLIVDQVQPLRKMGLDETVKHLVASLGIPSLLSDLMTMPARIGTLIPLEYHYNKEYTPRIPALQDLITMLVREVITLDEYVEYASWMGESRTETHWRLPAPDMVHDAFHRKIISGEEWNRYLVWHDYKPEPRPGVSKSDLDIVRGLRKTLIPRVDVRRGWLYNLIPDEDLLRRYELLGYEDDAETMTEIQKEAALYSDKNMIRRELMYMYAAGQISRDEFHLALEDVEKQRYPNVWYWKMRGELYKARVSKAEGVSLEELTEEVSGPAGED